MKKISTIDNKIHDTKYVILYYVGFPFGYAKMREYESLEEAQQILNTIKSREKIVYEYSDI